MGLSKSLTFSNLRDSDPPSKSLTFTAQSVFHYQTRSPLGAMGLFHHQSRSPFDDFPIGLSKSLTFRPMRETSESVFLVVLEVLFFKKHTLWACAAGACCPLARCVCLLQFKTTTVYRSGNLLTFIRSIVRASLCHRLTGSRSLTQHPPSLNAVGIANAMRRMRNSRMCALSSEKWQLRSSLVSHATHDVAPSRMIDPAKRKNHHGNTSNPSSRQCNGSRSCCPALDSAHFDELGRAS